MNDLVRLPYFRPLTHKLLLHLSKLAGFRDALIQQFCTSRSAISEPPKIRPLASVLRINVICALCCLSAVTHYGLILMSQ